MQRENIVIGIEGLVGSGKTTMCRDLLKRLPNSIMLNGGNLYRAIMYVLLSQGNNIEEMKKSLKNVDIKQMMDTLGVSLKIENNETMIYYKNKLLNEELLQSAETSLAVSNIGGIADNSHLFEFARDLIDNLKINNNIIISGRGIMRIYPDTDYHFFITATLEERARRKYSQYHGENTIEEVTENIRKRDELQERAGFYTKSDKTITIDVTNCKNAQEGTNIILEHIKQETYRI